MYKHIIVREELMAVMAASPVNTSTSPPTGPNPRGWNLDIATAVVLFFMTIIVSMRLWGRYRYKTPGRATKPQYGESRFWILLSDITIIISYVSLTRASWQVVHLTHHEQVIAVILSAVSFVAVHWGEGLHIGTLSITQIHIVLETFYVYQVLYKFVSGMAKVATLFLLLAISTPQMKTFRLFCKIFAAYIFAYCIATSVATVFQCGTSFASNWNKALDQSQCFYLPPFWYTHAAINISATAIMAILPWWLFGR